MGRNEHWQRQHARRSVPAVNPFWREYLGAKHVAALRVCGSCTHPGCPVELCFDRSAYDYHVTGAQWRPDDDPGYCAQTTTITHGSQARTFTYQELCRGQGVRWLDQLHREDEP